MADIYLPEDGYDTTLADAISTTDTSIPVTALPSFVTAGIATIFELDRVTIREIVYFATTATGPNRLTTVTRRLPFGPTAGVYTVGSTGTAKDHPKGARIAITSSVWYVGRIMSMLNDDEALPAVPKLPSSRTISSSRHLVDKEYADAAGAAAGGITAFYVTDNGGITVNIGAGRMMVGDTQLTFAGAAAQALTDNATNYVGINSVGTVVVSTTSFAAGIVPLAEVVTSGGDITGITDRRAWLTLGQNEKLITTAFTYGATIAAGQPLYLDTADGKWKLGRADNATIALFTQGIAIDAGADTDTGKRVQLGGMVSGLSGLTAGQYVYLSDTPGTLTMTPGTFSKAVGLALSTTVMYLFPTLDIAAIFGVNTSATTANLNELFTVIAATDITGAELQTLSGGVGSDATSLHRHRSEGFQRLHLSTTSRDGSVTVVAAAADNSVLIASYVTVSGAVEIIRFARDASGSYYQTHATTLTVNVHTGNTAVYPVVIGSYVYVPYADATGPTSKIRRFAVADLTGNTVMTISGTVFSSGTTTGIPAFTDGTDLFINLCSGETDSNYAKYTISDTTATNASSNRDYGNSARNQAQPRIHCDGTNVFFYCNNTSGAATVNNLYKLTLAGAAVSTTAFGIFGYGYASVFTTAALATAVTGLLPLATGFLFGAQADQYDSNAAFGAMRAVIFPIVKP